MKQMNRKQFLAMVDTNREYRIEELMEIWHCTRDCARARVLASLRTDNPIAVIYGKRGGKRYSPRKKYEYVRVNLMGDPSLPECPKCRDNGWTGEDGALVHLFKDEDGAIYCQNCAYEPPTVKEAEEQRIAKLAKRNGHVKKVECFYV